jgi:cysteine desulfurase family protein (TIGR01976 family)
MSKPLTLFPIDWVRGQFPALERTWRDRPAAYFDGPGGTQVAATCMAAMLAYMRRGGGNLHGVFPSSVETEAHIQEARTAMADLLEAAPEEIVFGANATTLAFALSRALGRDWKPGDEVVVTELDHRGNVDPWITQAADKGVTVRWIPADPQHCVLELDQLEALVNPRTRLVAVGLASNAVGTVNDVARIAERARQVGALVAVDAVQAVPHFKVDRDALGADLLLCSAYKFFGPHLGVATGRAALLDRLGVYKLVPAPMVPPDKLETGTQNHEGIAGLPAAVEFIASLGEGGSRRERLRSGYRRIEKHEGVLIARIREALAELPGVTLYQAPPHVAKTPTVAFTLAGHRPEEVCRHLLNEQSVFVASGDFYASTLADKQGVNPAGWVRAGLSPYNTMAEAERFIAGVTSLARG